jgi:hypothetical protein
MVPEDKTLTKELMALYTHWCIADAVRHAIAYEGRQEEADEMVAQFGKEFAELGRFQSSAMRLTVFYALIYVVVEGYRSREDPDPAVEALLSDDLIDKLRRFRNSVFHAQDDPIPDKQLAFLTAPSSEAWIKKLHRALERYLTDRLPVKEQLAKLRELRSEQDRRQ